MRVRYTSPRRGVGALGDFSLSDPTYLFAIGIAKLVAIIGGPLPDVPALVRTSKQPVPYLEAERLRRAAAGNRGFGATAADRTSIARVFDRLLHRRG